MKIHRVLSVCFALVLACPGATLAQGHGAQAQPPPRPAAPPPRPAQAPPPRPVAPPVQHQGGFSFPNDVGHPPPVQKPVALPVPPTSGGHSTVNYRQPAYNGSGGGGPYRGHFNGPPIGNPHHWGGWGWNHGVIWYPSPIYWGGGFWGPFALASLSAALLYGSIIDYQDQMIYPSYVVGPVSPGAQLLANYGLQQTECGPPNLVVIWGPGNSVICAYPNNLVGPGNYQLDPETLTIVSSS